MAVENYKKEVTSMDHYVMFDKKVKMLKELSLERESIAISGLKFKGSVHSFVSKNKIDVTLENESFNSSDESSSSVDDSNSVLGSESGWSRRRGNMP